MTKNRGILGPRARWTPEQDALLRALYPCTVTADIAARLGYTLSATYQRARKLGLSKDPAWIAETARERSMRPDHGGRLSRFAKGQTPPNKGRKCAPGKGGNHPNARRTQFVKGVRRGVAVELYQPIGTIRVTKDGYLSQKVNDGMPLQRRWRLLHLLRWEQKHGPIPKGFALKCLDGNRQNTDPSNWTLVPRAILPRLNGGNGRGKRKLAFDHAPAELKPAVLAVAKLEHAMHERSAGLLPR